MWTTAGALTTNDDARTLAIGKPDDAQSHFATLCQPDSVWRVMHQDGFSSPTFTEEPVPDELRLVPLSRS